MLRDTVLTDAIRNAPCLGPGHVNSGMLRGIILCDQPGQRPHPECAAAAVLALLDASIDQLAAIHDPRVALEALRTFFTENITQPVPVPG